MDMILRFHVHNHIGGDRVIPITDLGDILEIDTGDPNRVLIVWLEGGSVHINVEKRKFPTRNPSIGNSEHGTLPLAPRCPTCNDAGLIEGEQDGCPTCGKTVREG